jgi:transposase
VNRRAKPAKTDRIDVERMQRALGRYLRGEVDACSAVRVPSVEDEDAMRLHRKRKRLVRERSSTPTALHGIYDYRGPSRLKAEIRRELQQLELVLRMIKEVEAERDAILKEAAPQHHPNADKIKVLAGLSSIGPEFATRLVGEVFYRSFDNRRQLASFAGIAPAPCSRRADEARGVNKSSKQKE